MYTRRFYSSIDLDTLLYKLELKITIGNYAGIYTIATIDEKCDNCSWHTIDKSENMRITLMWKTVTLRSELVNCHLNVCFVPNTCMCPLISSLTLKFSNCWGNNQMLLLQLGSLLDQTWSWFNSIFANSVILTNRSFSVSLIILGFICYQNDYALYCKANGHNSGADPGQPRRMVKSRKRTPTVYFLF